jgi:preprotein translocase subunit SecY
VVATGRAQQTQRPRLLQAMLDAMYQPDLRRKLLFTFGMLVVFRFVAHVPIPGVDRDLLSQAFDNNAILGFLNLFSGGALRNLSVAALGVYPYITASIIMQLLVPIVPTLQALSREGEQGRRKIQLYTHWLAVPMAAVQGYSQLIILEQSGAVGGVGFTGSEALPTFAAVVSMVAGTMFLVWLGELITDNGVGNGISIIIFAGIVAGLPSLLPSVADSSVGFVGIMLLLVVGVTLVAFIVFFTEAQRRVPVQYARSLFRGGRMYRQSGQTHIPLRVNSAGMIPLIFAFSLVIFPSAFGQFLESNQSSGLLHEIGQRMTVIFDPQGGLYIAGVFLLTVMFAFFYTMVIFRQQNLAENLQKQGGFIPGIRPGRPTQEYILRVLVRITWAGAIFLGIVAVTPFFATRFTNVQTLTISSTGLLIMVAVALDTMKQIEAQLLMRDYGGFIR